MHDHIEWAKHLIEYVLGHVLFDIWIYVNLAFKSLNGLLIDPHLIQKVIVYTFWILLVIRIYHISLNRLLIDPQLIQNVLFVLSEYWYWMMLRMYLIMLEYLLVLIVDVWTSKIVNWFNLLLRQWMTSWLLLLKIWIFLIESYYLFWRH